MPGAPMLQRLLAMLTVLVFSSICLSELLLLRALGYRNSASITGLFVIRASAPEGNGRQVVTIADSAAETPASLCKSLGIGVYTVFSVGAARLGSIGLWWRYDAAN